MRLSYALPMIALLALAACNKGGAPSQSGASDPAANAKAAAVMSEMHLQPGLYASKVEVI